MGSTAIKKGIKKECTRTKRGVGDYLLREGVQLPGGSTGVKGGCMSNNKGCTDSDALFFISLS